MPVRRSVVGMATMGCLDWRATTDQAVLVVSGGAVPPATPPESFLVPFVSKLASTGHPVAAGETSTSTYDFVLLLRRTDGVDGRTRPGLARA